MDQITITGDTIKDLGIPEGPSLGKALAWAREQLKTGHGWEKTAREVKSKFREPELLTLRNPSQCPTIHVACSPSNEEEKTNVELSITKMKELIQSPIIQSAALMPDNCPSGNEWGTIPVGGAIKTEHEIIPAAHSSDAFCSLKTTFFAAGCTAKDLFAHLESSTAFGPFPTPEEKRKRHPVLHEDVWENPFLKDLNPLAENYLGSQGDGNHFSSIGSICVTRELLKNLDNAGAYDLGASLTPHLNSHLWTLTTHHGSRNLGARVFKRGLETAVRYTKSVAKHIPDNGAWLDARTPLGKAYWDALEYVGRWTKANHDVIHETFLKLSGAKGIGEVRNEHNAVFKRDDGYYHGKGATPAWAAPKGAPHLGIIPMNMGSEILIVAGGDNKQFLSFAPHGAGRNRSRSATLSFFADPTTKKIDRNKVEESIKEQTKDILIGWASGRSDVSESPIGYKDAKKIREEITQYKLATILGGITPKACIMAGEFEQPWRNKKKGISSPSLKKNLPDPNDPTL
jgi:hypothetical protein